jgi:hypothetical protein
MSAPLKLVTPYDGAGIAAELRRLADRIDAGAYGEAIALVLVLDAEKRTVMHMGRTSAINSHFLLAKAMRDLEEDY